MTKRDWPPRDRPRPPPKSFGDEIVHVSLAQREKPGKKTTLGLNNAGDRCYEQPGSGSLLKGWKTIALFFCVSIPSVQKYHNDWGMPVIRFMHKRGVWTTTGALDSWITELSKMQQVKVKAWNERNPEMSRRRIRTYYKLRE